jgi:hypothetical protein
LSTIDLCPNLEHTTVSVPQIVVAVAAQHVEDEGSFRSSEDAEARGLLVREENGDKVSVVDGLDGRITTSHNVFAMPASQSSQNGRCLKKSSSVDYRNSPSNLWRERMCTFLFKHAY